MGKLDRLSVSYIFVFNANLFPRVGYYIQEAWKLLNITVMRLWTAQE